MSLSKPISASSKSLLFNCNRHSPISVNLRDFERQAHILLNNLVALFVDNKPKYETQLAPTFYENRYGFREDELNNSQFSERYQLPRMHSLSGPTLSHAYRLVNNNPSTYQQIRGFKTKRQLSERSEEANFADILKSKQ